MYLDRFIKCLVSLDVMDGTEGIRLVELHEDTRLTLEVQSLLKDIVITLVAQSVTGGEEVIP